MSEGRRLDLEGMVVTEEWKTIDIACELKSEEKNKKRNKNPCNSSSESESERIGEVETSEASSVEETFKHVDEAFWMTG